MTRTFTLALALGTLLVLAAAAVRAQPAAAAEPAAQATIGELSCRSLLQLAGEERSFTLLYLHGFVSGRLNQQLLPVRELAAATDRLIDRCIDKPSDKALAVLEQVRAPGR